MLKSLYVPRCNYCYKPEPLDGPGFYRQSDQDRICIREKKYADPRLVTRLRDAHVRFFLPRIDLLLKLKTSHTGDYIECVDQAIPPELLPADPLCRELDLKLILPFGQIHRTPNEDEPSVSCAFSMGEQLFGFNYSKDRPDLVTANNSVWVQDTMAIVSGCRPGWHGPQYFGYYLGTDFLHHRSRILADIYLQSTLRESIEKSPAYTEWLVGKIGTARNILSFGPGTCAIEKVLAGKGIKVTGVDVNPKSVELGESFGLTMHQADANLFLQANAEQLSGQFDDVMAVESIGYYWLDGFLAGVREVLKPMGKLSILTVYNGSGATMRAKTSGFQQFTNDEIDEKCKRYGFSILERQFVHLNQKLIVTKYDERFRPIEGYVEYRFVAANNDPEGAFMVFYKVQKNSR
ncbi:MAG: class I SAM-dependent methyltransferase [Candidatus Margulisiibacteriota bacterium]